MMAFPQIGRGAQYPIKLTRHFRTVTNRSSGGQIVRYGEIAGATSIWDLVIEGISDSEWLSLESFFVQCEGRLREFTFLDPTANLLAESEDLSAPVWQRDPMIQLTPGIGDINGGDRATRLVNTAQAEQGIEQELPVPGDFRYTMSLFARSGGSSSVTLRVAAPSGTSKKTEAVSEQWRRLIYAAPAGPISEQVAFGLQIPPGASVDVYGIQVEAQWWASEYKRSAGQGGVFSKSHFDQDDLVRVTEAPNHNSTRLRIESLSEGY